MGTYLHFYIFQPLTGFFICDIYSMVGMYVNPLAIIMKVRHKLF